MRRGGPNYQAGLAKMRCLGDEIGIPIEVSNYTLISETNISVRQLESKHSPHHVAILFFQVYGPEATMTGICQQAIECISVAA